MTFYADNVYVYGLTWHKSMQELAAVSYTHLYTKALAAAEALNANAEALQSEVFDVKYELEIAHKLVIY